MSNKAVNSNEEVKYTLRTGNKNPRTNKFESWMVDIKRDEEISTGVYIIKFSKCQFPEYPELFNSIALNFSNSKKEYNCFANGIIVSRESRKDPWEKIPLTSQTAKELLEITTLLVKENMEKRNGVPNKKLEPIKSFIKDCRNLMTSTTQSNQQINTIYSNGVSKTY